MLYIIQEIEVQRSFRRLMLSGYRDFPLYTLLGGEGEGTGGGVFTVMGREGETLAYMPNRGEKTSFTRCPKGLLSEIVGFLLVVSTARSLKLGTRCQLFTVTSPREDRFQA